jgi:predicted acyl esterase
MLWLLAAATLLAQARFPQEFGYVTVRDGTRISYTLYRARGEGRHPTLLIYNMYDASVVTPLWNQTETAEISDYLERGYNVMGANVRGSACSTGTPDVLHTEQVGRDGAEVVEWIARQTWSDGAVGMFGHSGSGITQFYVAARQPAHLKAIIPGAAPADFYRDIAYPGGLFNYAFMYHWSEDAQPGQEERAARVHIAAGDRDCEAYRRTRKPSDFFQQLKSRPLDSDWWAERSIYPVASRIKTPTYVIFGWQDQNVASRAISVLDQLSGPRKMLLAEEGHSFYIRSLEVRREKLRFFDRWLKGVSNGAMDGKPITVWLSQKGSVERVPDRIARFDRLPPPETRWTRLYLSPERRLTGDPPKQAQRLSYLYPLGTAFVYGGDGYPHVPFGLGSLVFRGEPLAREQTLLGPMVARLFLSSSESDTSFFLVLNELTARGERKYLQRGYLLASLREVDTSKEALPRYAFRKRVPLQPNEPAEFTIELNWTGSVLRPGSRLELMIMAPGVAPEPNGQWGFLPLPMAINTLHLDPAHPSYLLLPIMEGVREIRR